MKLTVTHTTLCLFFCSAALLIGSDNPTSLLQKWVETRLFEYEDDSITEKINAVNTLLSTTKKPTVGNISSAESLRFNEAIHEYTKELCKFQQPHAACDKSLLPEFCSYINGVMIQKTGVIIPIPQNNCHWEKTSLVFLYPTVIGMLNFRSYKRGNDGYAYDTEKQFGKIYPYADELEEGTILPYHIANEMHYSPKYDNIPPYNSSAKSSMYDSVKEWHQMSEATAKMSVFSDGSFVITYPWGGIEFHSRNNPIQYFSINNSISAVCCNPHCKQVALGSYDGTIAVIDITQTDQNIRCKTKFKDYFLFLGGTVTAHPSIVATYQDNSNKTPISHIKYNRDSIIFSRKKNIYRGTLKYSESDMGKILTVEKILTQFPITAFDTIDRTIAYGTDDGYVGVADIDFCDSSEIKQLCELQITTDEINALCLHTTLPYLLTGTNKGSFDIWYVDFGATTPLQNIASIQHDAPIFSIEISPDQEHILVKTTKTKPNPTTNDNKHINQAYIYNTLEHLSESNQKYNEQMDPLLIFYKKNLKNAAVLHKILTQNESFLTKNNSPLVRMLRQNIVITITSLLEQKIDTIADLRDLASHLMMFPTISIGEHIEFNSSQPRSPEYDEDSNPLKTAKNNILLQQKKTFAMFIKRNLNKPYSKSDFEAFARKFGPGIKIDWDKINDDDVNNFIK